MSDTLDRDEAKAKYEDGMIHDGRSYEHYWKERAVKAESAIAAYREELRKKVEEERDGYIYKRDGWKPETSQHETYNLAVRIHDKFISLLDNQQTTKP